LLIHPTFKSIEMNFLNELLLKDQVEIFSSKIKKTVVFSVVKESKNCFSLEFTS
jgi:medium-chain acyl-[acyl-carrier-protein] hydrolase